MAKDVSRAAETSSAVWVYVARHEQAQYQFPTGWIIAAASFGFAIVQLDVTIVNVALPSMAKSLGASVAGLQWVVDAYTLAFAVLLLSAGVFGDLLERDGPSAGFGVLAIASLACGLAPNAAWLVAARVAQGVGAALVLPNSLALLNRATGHDPRGRAMPSGYGLRRAALRSAQGRWLAGC